MTPTTSPPAAVEDWDLVVVGAGPAGAATALGALRAAPELRVLLLDRDDFPRDKSCGDGIAPHVIDALRSVGAEDVVEGWRPLRTALARPRRHERQPPDGARRLGHPAQGVRRPARRARDPRRRPAATSPGAGGEPRRRRGRSDAGARSWSAPTVPTPSYALVSTCPPATTTARWRSAATRPLLPRGRVSSSSSSATVASRRTPGRSTAATASATWGTASGSAARPASSRRRRETCSSRSSSD